VDYAESSDEDDEAVFATMKARRFKQRRSRAAVSDEDEEEAYQAEPNDAEEDDGTLLYPCAHVVR
jgi:DNA mismatch repair protein MSH6